MTTLPLPTPRPRFALGRLLATPAALAALADAGEFPERYLVRHLVGDWGDVNAHDQQANEDALMTGARLLSAYFTRRGVKLWVITEADRSVTTILLPEDY